MIYRNDLDRAGLNGLAASYALDRSASLFRAGRLDLCGIALRPGMLAGRWNIGGDVISAYPAGLFLISDSHAAWLEIFIDNVVVKRFGYDPLAVILVLHILKETDGRVL